MHILRRDPTRGAYAVRLLRTLLQDKPGSVSLPLYYLSLSQNNYREVPCLSRPRRKPPPGIGVKIITYAP